MITLILFLTSAFCLAAYSQPRDPTKVCYPDVLQIQRFSLERKVDELVAYDYPNKLIAVRFEDGMRQVTDMSKLFVAIINDTAGTCEKNIIIDSPNIDGTRCLPENSTLLTNGTAILGLNPGSLEIEIWEYSVNISTETQLIIRTGVTKSSPSVPVITEYIVPDESADVGIFHNPKTSIDDPSIFNVPTFCPVISMGG